jgi:nitrous oxide reductase
MTNEIDHERRRLLGVAAITTGATELVTSGSAVARAARAGDEHVVHAAEAKSTPSSV